MVASFWSGVPLMPDNLIWLNQAGAGIWAKALATVKIKINIRDFMAASNG